MYVLGINGTRLADCPRCGGLLYLERLAFAHENLACAICGNRVDATILDNRQLSAHPAPGLRAMRQFPRLMSA